jgi:putative transposase
MRRVSFNLPHHAHYLTFSCYRRQQLLTDAVLCRRLLSYWDQARRRSNFAIWAYVIMPEHVHLLIWPRTEEYQIAAILRSLKEPFAHWVVDYWSSELEDRLDRITVKRASQTSHRFWQKGGGYDRNLYKWETIRKAIDYIENNPVRRKLVSEPSEWPWSSARCRSGAVDIPLVADPIDVTANGDAL